MKKTVCVLLSLLLCFFVTLVSCEDSSGSRVNRPHGGVVGGNGSVPTMGNGGSADDGEDSGSSGSSNGKYDKRVALTFDDGPHNVRTKAIVDELDKYGYNATFFVVGNRVDGTEYNGAAAMKYAYEHGNEIGIHGYTHRTDRYYDSCSDDIYKFELSETEKAIKAVIPNYNVRLMRPVGGKITNKRVQSCKYSVIMWSIDSEDWKYQYSTSGTEENNAKRDNIVNNVMSSVSDGDIILMHDIYQSTYDATVMILRQLNERGYEVVTVSELLGKNMSAGKSYTRALARTAQESVQSTEYLMICTNAKEKSDELC